MFKGKWQIRSPVLDLMPVVPGCRVQTLVAPEPWSRRPPYVTKIFRSPLSTLQLQTLREFTCKVRSTSPHLARVVLSAEGA